MIRADTGERARRRAMRTYEVHAKWDPEAKVWVATSEDVVGLVTEADTMEQLLEKLEVMVPELIEENGLEPALFDEFPVSVVVPLVAARKRKARRDFA